MDTLVRIEVLDPGASAGDLERAMRWFDQVETTCSRFDPASELRCLCAPPWGRPIVASPMLFEAVRFALAVAEASEGAFDPTVGAIAEARGYDRNHRSGERAGLGLAPATDVSFRDVTLDESGRTITLARPLLLDLAAVAKGLAVDMAGRALLPAGNFAIDAGGDLFLAGGGRDGNGWRVGIRHPRRDGACIAELTASDQAVCTSGDYERPAHLVNPRVRDGSAAAAASATVLAPTAMAADAFATAAFIMGPRDGIAWLEAQAVEGLIYSPELERFATRGLA